MNISSIQTPCEPWLHQRHTTSIGFAVIRTSIHLHFLYLPNGLPVFEAGGVRQGPPENSVFAMSMCE